MHKLRDRWADARRQLEESAWTASSVADTVRAGPEKAFDDHGLVPARWKRAGAIAGLIAAVLLVVTLLLLSSLPSADSPAQAVAAHLRARYALTVTASYIGVLTSMALIPFASSLRAFTRGRGADAEWRWTATLLSAAAGVSLLLVGSTLLGAAAVLARQTADAVDGPAVCALYAAAKVCLSFALTPFGVVVLANARAVSSGMTPVRWLVRLDVEIGILALVSSAAVFIHSGWFSAGEQVAVVIGVLVALWITAIALVMLEGAEVAVPG